VHALSRAATVVRGIPKYAYEVGLIESPVRLGKSLSRPSAVDKRRARRDSERKNGKRLLTGPQVRSILDDAPIPLKALILLGINGGFGNTDCSVLPMAALDLDEGMVDFERPIALRVAKVNGTNMPMSLA